MRDFIVIGSMVVVVIIVGAILFYFGPPSLKTDVGNALMSSLNATTTVPYTVLEKGNSAGSVDEETNYRITTREDLDSLWMMVYDEDNNLPQIDFTKYEVLAVFDGSHSTGGYDISVASVNDANGQRMVVIDHTKPGCAEPASPTNPFEIIQVPKTTYTLQHQDVTTVTPCE